MIKQLGVVVIGAALMTPFLAQAEGAYVGFNAGRANQKLSIDELGSGKDSATGYKLYGGYEFNQYFGVQAGYANLGKVKDAYADANVQLGLSSKVTSLYLAATATLPLNDQFSVFGKLGVSRNRVKATFSYAAPVLGLAGYESDSETRTTPLIGIGAAYNFSKNLAVLAEYENFGKVAKDGGDSLKANLFSVGLRYKF